MSFNVSTEWILLDVADATEMRAYVAKPGDTPKAGLLVFQEAFGVNAHIRDVTERFAKMGYLAIAPELYHRTGPGFEGSYTDFAPVMPHMQGLTEESLAADIQAAYDWMAEANGPKIGCIGFCLGGRCSFIASISVPVDCAVSFYGGGIAPSAMSNGLLEKTPDVQCPILLFWGGLDKHILPEQYNAVENALKEADKDYINVVLSKADHGFFCDARASYNPIASREALALTMAFFDEHLAVSTYVSS